MVDQDFYESVHNVQALLLRMECTQQLFVIASPEKKKITHLYHLGIESGTCMGDCVWQSINQSVRYLYAY